MVSQVCLFALVKSFTFVKSVLFSQSVWKPTREFWSSAENAMPDAAFIDCIRVR